MFKIFSNKNSKDEQIRKLVKENTDLKIINEKLLKQYKALENNADDEPVPNDGIINYNNIEVGDLLVWKTPNNGLDHLIVAYIFKNHIDGFLRFCDKDMKSTIPSSDFILEHLKPLKKIKQNKNSNKKKK